jgi:putative transposase
MRWLYQPLLLLLASSTDSELAKQVEYLRAGNQILQAKLGKRPYLSEREKRLLVKLGQVVGKGIKDLLTIVAYPTFRRWVGLYDPAGAGTKPQTAKGNGGRAVRAGDRARVPGPVHRVRAGAHPGRFGQKRKDSHRCKSFRHNQ